MEVYLVYKHVGWGERRETLGVYKNLKDVEFDLHKLGFRKKMEDGPLFSPIKLTNSQRLRNTFLKKNIFD